ncbi:hypothetical protein RYH80_17985 [Halobaculum sp. MBLA0147]|uniref:hypothetical protein n=1 Tax=Halobaculum sp. MBLA0147 TaxID=3079934 RepID=UPI003523C6D8
MFKEGDREDPAHRHAVVHLLQKAPKSALALAIGTNGSRTPDDLDGEEWAKGIMEVGGAVAAQIERDHRDFPMYAVAGRNGFELVSMGSTETDEEAKLVLDNILGQEDTRITLVHVDHTAEEIVSRTTKGK